MSYAPVIPMETTNGSRAEGAATKTSGEKVFWAPMAIAAAVLTTIALLLVATITLSVLGAQGKLTPSHTFTPVNVSSSSSSSAAAASAVSSVSSSALSSSALSSSSDALSSSVLSSSAGAVSSSSGAAIAPLFVPFLPQASFLTGGSNFNDVYSSGHLAAFSGAYAYFPFVTDPKYGNVVNASNINTGDELVSTVLFSPSFTFTVLFNPQPFPVYYTTNEYILIGGVNPSPLDGSVVVAMSASQVITAQFASGAVASPTYNGTTGAVVVPFNQWTHIGVTYNITTQTMSIYINGTLDKSNSSLVFNTTTANHIGVANIAEGSPNNTDLNALIYLFNIYNQSLNAGQMLNLSLSQL